MGRENFRTYFTYMRYWRLIRIDDTMLIGRKKNQTLRTCLCEASAFVAAQIRIEEYRMKYPQAVMFTQSEAQQEPDLFWNPLYGKRDLIEILTSLEELAAFTNKSGQPASFASIVTHFESLLKIDLPRPYQIRTQVLERKIKRTDFIDKMKDALLKKADNN